MSRDRDGALRMDRINRLNRALIGAHQASHAYGDQVVVRIRNLLPANQDRAVRAASDPLTKPTGGDLIVIGDRYDVEARAKRFTAKV
jgi:hypothetical protein